MSTFTRLDPIIKQWASDRRIPLITRHKDEDVRSFQIVGLSGSQCQIWIELDEVVVVSVWDYGERRRDRQADADSLRVQLDEALSIARAWVEP